MRAVLVVLLISTGQLSGCETTPTTDKAVTQAAASQPRCEKREVTGSRLARCDKGPAEVRSISREEIEATGMPSGGPGRGGAEGG